MAGKRAAKKNKKVVKVVKEEVEEVKEEVKEEVEEVKEEVVEEKDDYELQENLLSSILEKFSSIGQICPDDLNKFKKELISDTKNAINNNKKLKKQFSKSKGSEKKKRKVTTSGFDKLTDLNKEAKTFITKHCKVDLGDGLLSRRMVNKHIHTYIKSHNLQNPEMKREILPDKALQTILSPLSKEKNPKNGKIDAEEGYNYFNLQKYIKHIFIKVD